MNFLKNKKQKNARKTRRYENSNITDDSSLNCIKLPSSTNATNTITPKITQYFTFDLVNTSSNSNFEVINSKIMQRAIILMRLIGLYHQKKDSLLLKLFPFFVLICLWLNSFRFLTNLNFVYGENEDFLSGEFLVKTCIIINTAVFAINSTIIFINQEFKHRELKLLNELNFLLQVDYDFKNLITKLTPKIANLYIVASLFTAIQSAIIFTGLFLPRNDENDIKNNNNNVYLSPFHRYSWSHSNTIYKLAAWLLHSVSFSQSFYSSAYFISHCKILIQLFESFNKKLKVHIIKRSGNVREKEFENFRIWHLKLIYAVKRLDICYNQFLGCSILSSISSIVIIIYLFTSWTKLLTSIELKITFTFSISVVLFITLIKLFTVADISTQVI